MEENQKSSKLTKIALVVFGSIAIIQLGVLGVVFKDEIGQLFSSIEKESVELTQPLPDMQINLADSNGSNYLKVSMHLGYTDQKVVEELEGASVKLQATIVEILRTKSLTDINTTEKTDALAVELLEEINELLGEDVITNIYFTEFLYQ